MNCDHIPVTSKCVTRIFSPLRCVQYARYSYTLYLCNDVQVVSNSTPMSVISPGYHFRNNYVFKLNRCDDSHGIDFKCYKSTNVTLSWIMEKLQFCQMKLLTKVNELYYIKTNKQNNINASMYTLLTSNHRKDHVKKCKLELSVHNFP